MGIETKELRFDVKTGKYVPLVGVEHNAKSLAGAGEQLDLATEMERGRLYVAKMRKGHAPTCGWVQGKSGCTCGVIGR